MATHAVDEDEPYTMTATRKRLGYGPQVFSKGSSDPGQQRSACPMDLSIRVDRNKCRVWLSFT
jgi:hypothetical protein